MYVYVDESGDLGFSSKSTHFFIVSYLVIEYPFDLEKSMRRLLKRLHEKREYARRQNELKFSKSKDAVRCKVLNKICKHDIEIGFVVLEKGKVKPDLRKKINVLYNYVVAEGIIPEVLPYINKTGRLFIVIDKSLPRSSWEAFNTYTKNKATYTWSVKWGKTQPLIVRNIEILHRNSENEPCLQAADFLAGAGFHKFEFGNNNYYKIIEGKVKHFRYLWK